MSEDQGQDPDHHHKPDQENDPDGSAKELQHARTSLVRTGRGTVQTPCPVITKGQQTITDRVPAKDRRHRAGMGVDAAQKGASNAR